MARPSAIAALLLLVISLLVVTHCHTVAVASDHAAVAVSDENELSSNPTLAAAIIDEEALPAEQQHGFQFLRVPSDHPCRLHRHRLWKPHHRIYTRDPACMFNDYDHYSGHDGEAVSHHDILPGAEARETEKVKPVAEPDPDRSLQDSDGEVELVASREPSSFADTDGLDGEPWKEMLRRWLRYAYFHLHHGTCRHRLHLKQEEEEATPETDEVEEMVVRRFRKAFMRIRRRFGHDAEHARGFFQHLHHDHRHRHAEETEKPQAGGDLLSGVTAWIKGLMNRF